MNRTPPGSREGSREGMRSSHIKVSSVQRRPYTPSSDSEAGSPLKANSPAGRLGSARRRSLDSPSSSLCFLKDDLGTGGRGPPPVPVQELGIGPPTIRVDSNITEDMDAFCEEVPEEPLTPTSPVYHSPTRTFERTPLEVNATQTSPTKTVPLVVEPQHTVNLSSKDWDGGEGEQSMSECNLEWRLGNMIGSGAYGRVYLGMVPQDGRLIAIKQLEYMENVAEDVEKVKSLDIEIALLRQLRSEHICGYLGTTKATVPGGEMKLFNIVLEYIPGGSISSLIQQFGAFEERTVVCYTRQILRGLDYLHQNKVVHRDIKGANILVTTNGTVKLTDFGHSTMLYSTLMTKELKSLKGTPYWMAPEVVKQEGYGRRADIWSMACTVVEMATGKAPWWEVTNSFSVMMKIATSREHPTLPENFSATGKSFCVECFAYEPDDRPSADALLGNIWLALDSRPISVPIHRQRASKYDDRTT